jgi:hypothetical protein
MNWKTLLLCWFGFAGDDLGGIVAAARLSYPVKGGNRSVFIATWSMAWFRAGHSLADMEGAAYIRHVGLHVALWSLVSLYVN